MPGTNEFILEAEGLHKAYDLKRKPRDYAVFDFSLNIKKGEILGLVGESGCGKSTLGKMLLKLEKPTKGRIVFQGSDISNHSYDRMRPIRNRMQMVFQGASTSFNPYFTVREIIGEPLDNYCRDVGEKDKLARISALLEKVGLGPQYLNRYPGEMSGGQRQRVGIARALILEPDFVVCDESVSSVDHAIKNQILNLLAELKKERGCTYLFISHDLASVAKICDRVAVMYLGNLVEVMPQAELRPRHPYTQALMAATLSVDPRRKKQAKVMFKDGEEMLISRTGCVFQNRCLFAAAKCGQDRPPLMDKGKGHLAACHLDHLPYIEEC